VKSILFEPPAGASAEQMAQLFCRTFASPVGAAQVVGDRVVIFDRGSRLQNFGAAMKALAQRAPR
jgi:hypothetical protein